MAKTTYLSMAVALVISGISNHLPAQSRIVLSDVTVIDPRDGPELHSHMDVVIEKEKVKAVRPHRAEARSAQVRIVSFPGAFALPGFIDTHVHTLLSPRATDGQILPKPQRESTALLLRSLLEFGITTIRDPGDPTQAVVRLKGEVTRGTLLGPTMFVAGRILNSTAPGPEFVAVRSREDVCKEVEAQAKAGVDFIKVYSGLGPELVASAIECAHRRNLRVIGHLQATTWTEAADLGIDAIAHGAPWSPVYLDAGNRTTYDGSLFGRVQWLRGVDLQSPAIQDMVRKIASRQIPVDPTLIAYHTKFWGNDPRYHREEDLLLVPREYRNGWQAGSFTAGWTAAQYSSAQAQWHKQEELINLLYRGGVRLTVGTDTPTPWIVPGLSFHGELILLHEAGLANIDVLKAATQNGAVSLGQADRIGCIRPGFEADLVILKNNPSLDLTNTRSIVAVISRGRLILPAPRMQTGRSRKALQEANAR